MSEIMNQIESALLSDMRAVELAVYKISNANRPLSGISGDGVFIDRVSPDDGPPRLALVSQPATDAAEQMALKKVFDPESPMADSSGFVSFLDVDLAQEMIEITLHKRSYELGVKLFNASASMGRKAMSLGKE